MVYVGIFVIAVLVGGIIGVKFKKPKQQPKKKEVE